MKLEQGASAVAAILAAVAAWKLYERWQASQPLSKGPTTRRGPATAAESDVHVRWSPDLLL